MTEKILETYNKIEGTNSPVAWLKKRFSRSGKHFPKSSLIKPQFPGTMQGAGVNHKGVDFITHSTLEKEKSALKTFTNKQKLFLFTLLILIVSGLIFKTLATLTVLIAILSVLYLADTIFNAILITRSLKSDREIRFGDKEIGEIDEASLPRYTILCPLYHESSVLPQFVENIKAIDWPKDKLEVLLLLEGDDTETRQKASSIDLPEYFQMIDVPESQPKTKPKACNFGLTQATGKYLVIYDAEDKPDPLQLKKAYLAFQKSSSKIACFQAKLNYYNTHQNILTRFFTAEYSLWFDLILPGMQSLDTTIPLGGTSNHFRTADLRAFKGWDPFNVTEDADLGVRLFKDGYKTAIIDSYTLEEANSKVKNWLRQRSRWIKGYIQTYLVHSRKPIAFVRDHKHHSLFFHLIVGGKIIFAFVNPIMWATTISYFAFRATVGPTIEQLYPAPILYMAAASLILGNFLFIYYYMIAAAKLGKYNLIKFILFIPVYWALISTAFWIALWQLIVKPHYWEKTTHGFHLPTEKESVAYATSGLPAWERVRRARKIALGEAAGGAILVLATITAHFFNFLYNAYLGRSITIEEFGLVSLFGSFFYISTIPLGALARTITYRSAYLFGKHREPVRRFWSYTRRRAFLVSFAVTATWLAATPFLARFFNEPTWEPFILFAPIWLLGALDAVDAGFLRGILKFKVLALITVVEAVAKLGFSIFLVNFSMSRFVYAATPISMALAVTIGWLFARRTPRNQKLGIEEKGVTKFPAHFFATSIFTNASAVSFLSFDVILAKHFLSPVAAGEYALVAILGKMIYFISTLFGQFILPLVSHAEGAHRDSQKTFYKLFAISAATTLAAYLAVGLFGSETAELLIGPKVRMAEHFLPLYGLGVLCFALATTIVTYHQARGRHIFAQASFALAMLQIGLIISFHGDISQIVGVMSFVGLVSFALILFLHIFYDILATIGRNVIDLLTLFSPVERQTGPKKQKALRILIFNWRDTRHVWAGGAEVYLHQVAKRLVARGHYVTLYCGNDGHCQRNEVVDGVNVIRRGGFYTVYLWAFLYYITQLKGKYDVIIDSANGIPFFTPLYSRKPIAALVHHVHQEVFRTGLSAPLALLAKFLEAHVMPRVYRGKKIITVSQSSKEALERLGFGKKMPITVVNPGVDLSEFSPHSKTKYPSVLYLGRLKPYKSIDVLVRAMTKIKRKVPSVRLTVAGEGESREDLEKLSRKLKLGNVIHFVGKIPEKAKTKLMAESWVMVQPSMIEGWGITIIEANAAGTPVVAANVPGLRDSVHNPHTGFLVDYGDVSGFAKAIAEMLQDKKLREITSEEAKSWAKQFSWDKTAEICLEVLR